MQYGKGSGLGEISLVHLISWTTDLNPHLKWCIWEFADQSMATRMVRGWKEKTLRGMGCSQSSLPSGGRGWNNGQKPQNIAGEVLNTTSLLAEQCSTRTGHPGRLWILHPHVLHSDFQSIPGSLCMGTLPNPHVENAHKPKPPTRHLPQFSSALCHLKSASGSGNKNWYIC